MNRTVLVVDDDAKIANLISIRLRKQGYSPYCVSDGKSAIDWVEKNEAALIMLDVRLPDISGVEVLREIIKKRPGAFVIMISAHAEVQLAVECIKYGASDFLEKPFEFAALDAKVAQVFKRLALEEEVAVLKKELGASYKNKSLLGHSETMRNVFHSIDLAAKSDVTVLILGESGTGKELVARAIQSGGPLQSNPFVVVNCGAIPENLIESELFGHEKGAFTGAIGRKIGKFEQAQGGTIFLDEIGELPLAMQVKLLRVIQEKEIERVGGSQVIPIQVRLITATNRDLKKMVEEGKFREDLYYRINVFPVRIPPLRNRKEDIPELFMHFVNKHRKDKGPVKTDELVMTRLTEYDWPGNVRELENFVERLMLVLGDQNLIREKDILALGLRNAEKPAAEEPAAAIAGSGRIKAIGDAEKAILEKALNEAGGNVAKASRMVEMSRDTFYRKMKKYAIRP